MSHKQKTTSVASLKPIFDQVFAAIDVLRTAQEGEAVDEESFKNALNAIETFCRISVKVMPHAKPSTIQEAVTLVALEALPGKPLPLAGEPT